MPPIPPIPAIPARLALGAIAAIATLVSAERPARAFEADPTHAAITETAARLSPLGNALYRWGRAGGIYETIELDLRSSPRTQAAQLRDRIAALNPGAGYAPGANGKLQALGWVVAGSVLEESPSSRARHHFLDPESGKGLDDARVASAFAMMMLGAADSGGTFAGIFTGTNFDETGEPADHWALRASDFGLLTFWRELARSARADMPAARDHHLATALLALGGVLHVLQDMAVPARTRNDFRAEYLEQHGDSVFDRASGFERFVANAYGRTMPGDLSAGPARRRAADFFRATDRMGLADFTARNFFSLGTLPQSIPVSGRPSRAEWPKRVNQHLARPEPLVRIDGAPPGYVRGVVPHLARVRLDEQRLTFDLDRACYSDYAAALLPEAVRSSRDFMAHVLRGRLDMRRDDNQLSVTAATIDLRAGQLDVLWEDQQGVRRMLHTKPVAAARLGQTLWSSSIAIPQQARALVVVYEGQDAAGDSIVIVDTLRL